MAYLRQYRLQQAHGRLASSEPGEATVTDVALACGFRHLGRFAADYHRRYGRAPSDTLRLSRTRAVPDGERRPEIRAATRRISDRADAEWIAQASGAGID
jgi:AraC-like DNA-binding protein